VGSRDSIPRVHIIWYQSKVSNQVLFYLFLLAYLILGLHCSRVTKKKKKNPKIVMSLIINRAAYIIIVTLSFVFYSLILILVLVLILVSWT
jgi:hypothetical protein